LLLQRSAVRPDRGSNLQAERIRAGFRVFIPPVLFAQVMSKVMSKSCAMPASMRPVAAVSRAWGDQAPYRCCRRFRRVIVVHAASRIARCLRY